MYLIDNQPKVQIRLNNATIVNQLYQALVLNIEDDSKVKVLMQPMFNSATELQIYLDSPRIAQRLGTFGVELIRIGKMYLIAVEKGMSREKEYFPIDSVHINGDFKFTTLGLIEKIKVLATCAKHYRINVRYSIASTKAEFPNFGTVGISSIATHQMYPIATIPSYFAPLRPMRPLRGQPLHEPKGFEEVGVQQGGVKFWQEAELGGDTFKNTTFDKGVALKTHVGGYHNRDAKVSTPPVDPIHGDDFSNRSFDRQFARQTARTPEEISAQEEAIREQLDKDFEGSGPLLFEGGPVMTRDPVLQRDKFTSAGPETTAGIGGDYDADETYALSAHHISSAQFDLHLGGLKVIFDDHILLFGASGVSYSDQPVCRFELNPKDENHARFARYISSDGALNLKTKLVEHHNLGGCNIVVLIDDGDIEIKIDTISAKTFNRITQTFAVLKKAALKPRDTQGNVADVELEDNTPIPKKSSNLFIRIKDEGVFIDVNGVGHEVQVKPWDDKSLLLVSDAIGYPREAELKMLAVTLKANYGGKAKGDIEVFIGENHVGDRGLVLVLGPKPRFSHLRSMLEKHIVE